MKKTIYLTAMLIALFLTASISSGQAVVKETRDVTGFSSVNFGVPGELYIEFGPKFQVILEGKKKYLDQIETEVTAGRLVIKEDNRRIWVNEKVTGYITMPDIVGLGVSGSGKAEVKDALKAGDLDLSVTGSGRLLTADLDVTNLDCSISGSGNVVLGSPGGINKADISISGSGNFSGESVKINMLDVRVSGSGNCNCKVEGSLNAHISGSGNVNFAGTPRIDARISGSGHVRPR